MLDRSCDLSDVCGGAGHFAQHNKLSGDEPRSASCSFELGASAMRSRFGAHRLLPDSHRDRRQAVNRHRVDGALSEVHRQPLGNWLLAVVAAGLLAFAVFSCFEARYQRL